MLQFIGDNGNIMVEIYKSDIHVSSDEGDDDVRLQMMIDMYRRRHWTARTNSSQTCLRHT